MTIDDLLWLRQAVPNVSEIVPLQQGGQKLVFRCKHPQFGSCVLKVIRPGAVQRLDRELEAVRRLKQLPSSNVPRVYQCDVASSPLGQIVWLLEQCVEGTDLSEILRGGSLAGNQVVRLSLDLVTTAAGAESVNVVHRDIKPQNIRVDDTGKAWLLDFGIARILDLESKTGTDVVSGPHTPGYSAPEQFRYQKRNIDGRADLFAIGVVMYESATGVNPFVIGARDRLEILHRVERDPLPRLHLAWDPAGKFGQFVTALTQKQPYQRPRSCAEALVWLEEVSNEIGGGA